MKKLLVLLVVLALSMFGVSAAFAYDVKVDEDTYAKVGAKVQILITDTDNTGATSNETDLTLPNARIYFAGQVTNMVKFGLNYDFATVGSTSAAGGRATDAQITLDFAKELKVMTGIYRVAFSRIALQDSYAYILITGPVVDRSAAPVAGGAVALGTYRNAGVTAWGDLLDGKLRYNLGVWDDNYNVVASNKPMKTARVVFNFLDPEKGYTCGGCYLGKSNVANVGFGYLTQDYGIPGSTDLTYTSMTIDGFYESNGLTLEAAYFSSDDDSGVAGGKPTSWYAQAAYMIGDLQPAARYESYDDDGGTGDYTQTTAGINYIFDGQNAKVGVQYSKYDPDLAGAASLKTYSLQLQVQF